MGNFFGQLQNVGLLLLCIGGLWDTFRISRYTRTQDLRIQHAIWHRLPFESNGNVNHAICVSHAGKENIVLRGKLAAHDVSVIPNAVDSRRFVPDLSCRPPPPTVNVVVVSRFRVAQTKLCCCSERYYVYIYIYICVFSLSLSLFALDLSLSIFVPLSVSVSFIPSI